MRLVLAVGLMCLGLVLRLLDRRWFWLLAAGGSLVAALASMANAQRVAAAGFLLVLAACGGALSLASDGHVEPGPVPR